MSIKNRLRSWLEIPGPEVYVTRQDLNDLTKRTIEFAFSKEGPAPYMYDDSGLLCRLRGLVHSYLIEWLELHAEMTVAQAIGDQVDQEQFIQSVIERIKALQL